MGFIPTEESRKNEIEDFKRMLVACAGLSRRKDEEEQLRFPSLDFEDDGVDKIVCVTSGVSFLGLAIVNRLLVRGYSVRILVDNQGEVERRENEERGVVAVEAVMASLFEVERLKEAFSGCRGVFHTGTFADPAGLSGYTKSMGDIEVKAAENVVEACSTTQSVRSCVLTSSLLACIWRDCTLQDYPCVINHHSWSDEPFCRDKRLWYALGKLRAEKAAWSKAKEKGVKLATICPGLVTGPEFFARNPTSTVAYLKGAQEMYADGVLATVDVMKVAEAHACVFEGMKKTGGGGRYICYDKVIEREDVAEKLAEEVGMPIERICGHTNNIPSPFQLSNTKLSNLMSTTLRTCYNHR
ncbi:Cinnamoyl-CoA reductase-like SNL6 [Linum perenne]